MKPPNFSIGAGKMLQVIGGFFVVMFLAILFVKACGDNEPPIEMYNVEEPGVIDTILRT